MILAVTNRKLVKTDFIRQIENLADAGPEGIILREKDLSAKDYKRLAGVCLKICEEKRVPLIVNTFYKEAEELGIRHVQLPYPIFMKCGKKEGGQVGVSVHSAAEAKRAEEKGADYLIAGHIYETNSKKGLPQRGVEFLEEVCSSVKIPVFAIGGIKAEQITEVIRAGAAGICVMSELMYAEEPREYINKYRKELQKTIQD